MQPVVYVKGIAGLANNLFQIALAFHYVQQYGCRIVLDKNSVNLAIGSSTFDDRDTRYRDASGRPLTYFQTIFKNIESNVIPDNIECKIVQDHFCQSILQDDHLLISGYCQKYEGISSSLRLMRQHLYLEDQEIQAKVDRKYQIDPSNCNIMFGLRIGFDYRHMTKLTVQSYQRAIDKIVSLNTTNAPVNIYVIADVKTGWQRMIQKSDKYNLVFVDEDDITQFYVGLMCNNFILSESTYHYWIALLASLSKSPSNIVYFDNTLISAIGVPQDWIKLNYY